MTLRPEWVELDSTVNEIARWLREDRHGRGAVMHGGFGNHVGGGLSVSVDPNAAFTSKPKGIFWPPPEGTTYGPAKKPRGAVVIFDMKEHEWYEFSADASMQKGPVIPPFEEHEVESFRQALVDAGMEVTRSWNGAGFHTASFGISGKSMNISHTRAADRYLEGCPTHGSVFCSRDGCTWHHDGHARLAEPNFVFVPPAGAPAPPPPSDDDRNLEAVRRALQKVKPLLEELGHHQSTIVAGRRGVIEGEPGDLRFEPIEGHGVCLPAEAAEALVELAMQAFAMGLDS